MSSTVPGAKGRRQPRGARPTVTRRGRYHHGDLRRALIDAALKLAVERGPGAFNLADLCRAVGVSTAAPYRHFESLDQLMAEAAQEGFALLDAKTAESFRGADWQARLASCVADYVGFVRAAPGHAIAMFEARTQTVAEPDWNPLHALELPAPRNATEAAVYACWHAGTASFTRYAEGLARALAESPLAAAVNTRQRALETALALFTIMQGIAAQWLDRALPDDWLDRGARKAFDKIVLPWALGVAQQAQLARRRAAGRR
jgi:AcrR family transcriptional regulator